MKAYLYRSGFAMFPAYPSDSELLMKYREGDIVEVEIKKARNPKNHRRFFALLKLGFENQEQFTSPGWFREYVLIKAGHFDYCKAPDGSTMVRAKSISFAGMDELEFQEMYRDVSQVICEMCRVTPKVLEENLNLFT